MVYKGSKKHILNLIDSNDFIDIINTILWPYNAYVSDKNTVQPKGRNDAAEYGLQAFINKHNLAHTFPQLNDFNFNNWWMPSGGKAPTWDMLSLCQINGKEGILLVEAKAHVGEFSKSGKPALREGCSSGSYTNHTKIEHCIQDACNHLKSSYNGFHISVNQHYQLSNRIAFAWQLQQLNVPVVLLYLGFTGDTYFKDYFKDGHHWKSEFRKYTSGVIPDTFINTKESDFLFINSSLPVNNI